MNGKSKSSAGMAMNPGTSCASTRLVGIPQLIRYQVIACNHRGQHISRRPSSGITFHFGPHFAVV